MQDYPFEPKSNAYLVPGQFWGVPLSTGRWACGRVLATKTRADAYFPGNSRMFLAALMDWHGDEPPSAPAIAGRPLLAQGWAHVKSIRLNGRVILGCRDLALDGIRGLREVTHRAGGTVMLYEGAVPLRPATAEEAAALPVFSTWGLTVISVLAERLFVKHLPLAGPGASARPAGQRQAAQVKRCRGLAARRVITSGDSPSSFFLAASAARKNI